MKSEHTATVAQIGTLLHGKPPAFQSAVLADLLAMWLAGHFPAEIRESLLKRHIALVRELLPLNSAISEANREQITRRLRGDA